MMMTSNEEYDAEQRCVWRVCMCMCVCMCVYVFICNVHIFMYLMLVWYA